LAVKVPTLDIKTGLRDPLLHLLWRQWSALGVPGHTDFGKTMIDPEALVLVSTVFARHDARLFDEMFDWLRANGTWINLLRLNRLQNEFGLGDSSILGAIAEHLAQDSANLKWKALVRTRLPVREARLLFSHLPDLGGIDEKFLRWGWRRPPVEARGLSRTPRPDHPATFLIKLRALFGRQSRAEVLAWLLCHEAGHPAQIARETGYFRGSVQNVLNELEISGHVQASRRGREKFFSAAKRPWRFLTVWDDNPEPAFPPWLPWAALFASLQRTQEFLESPGIAGHSEDLQAIEFNRLIEPLAARLREEGYAPAIANFPEAGGIPAVLAETRDMIEALDT
jgi:hypothetical protein